MREFIDWKDYQEETAAFFRRQGCLAEVDTQVQGVRAKHAIDVYVNFFRLGIECKWVIECKLWKSRVPKEKVLALKSIVDDVGADRGVIISEKGFQIGAYDASRSTNITLVTSLEEFKNTALTVADGIQLEFCEKDLGMPIYKFPKNDQPQTLLRYEDKVIVANWGTGNIAIVNPANKSIIRTIELDNYEARSPTTKKRAIRKYPPGSMTVADGKLFVGQVFSEFLLTIDLDTHAIVKRISLPGGGEGELISSPDGKSVYFASNRENQFYIIDSATYQYKVVSYPGNGRGCMSIFAHPLKRLLYIGIQRGGALNGKSLFGGNSFLAVYDLSTNEYVDTIYLAEILNGSSDDSTPICIRYDKTLNNIYVGMFQSRKGIYIIDAETNEIVGNIAFKSNKYNKHFEWVDALAQAFYKEFILSVNRNNCELVFIRKENSEVMKTTFLGVAPNGPRDIVVMGDEAIVSYPARNGLIFVKLDEFA